MSAGAESPNSGADSANCKIKKETFVVPWYNVAQFKKVYEYLYSSEVAKKRWAVDQITVWETRCHPSLPTAVEASQVLTRAMIQDILLTNGASLCQVQDIQMMYALALVRFVNLTVETHQKERQDFSTTAQVAKGIGIPPWVVELRNEVSHSCLPSLPALRMAAETAMKYISESYWEKEITVLKDTVKERFDDTDFRDLVISYIDVQFRILSAQERKEPSDKAAEYKVEWKSILKKILLALGKNKREFIDALVSEGLFIPIDEDLREICSHEEQVQYEEKYDDEKPHDPKKSLPPLPPFLVDLWKPLLKLMNRMQVVPLFLEVLLKSQADRSEMGQKLVMAWVQRILKIHTLGIEDPALKEVFKPKGMVVNWQTMFHAAVSRPCVYVLYILPLIFTHINLNEHRSRYILNLLAIMLGQGNWRNVKLSTQHNIYTVEDLKQMKKKQQETKEKLQKKEKLDKKEKLEKSEKKEKSEDCNWFIPEDDSYKKWPIGYIADPIGEEDEAESQPEDFILLEDFNIKEDDLENCFTGPEDPEVENVEVITRDPNDFRPEDLNLYVRESFLYKKK